MSVGAEGLSGEAPRQRLYNAAGRTYPAPPSPSKKEKPLGAAPFDTSQPQRSWAPRRKPLAGFAAGGLAGNIAVIASWHFPMMPDTVVAAYASLAVTLVGFVVAYLVPSEDQS